ncbi:MAG: DUF2510 domain-containing protein [Microbacteriaceae bacterium]
MTRETPEPTQSPTTNPPAGWYPDPETQQGQRWWDGLVWTEHRQNSAVSEPPQPPAPTRAVPSLPKVTSAPTPLPSADWGMKRGDYVLMADSGADAAAGKNTPAKMALTFGIIGVLVNIFMIPGTLAIIFGVIGLKRAELSGIGRVKSIWGIVLGSVTSVVSLIFIISIMLA